MKRKDRIRIVMEKLKDDRELTEDEEELVDELEDEDKRYNDELLAAEADAEAPEVSSPASDVRDKKKKR